MKVLILDSTFACRGIYDSLITLGHSVFTIGNRKDDFFACNNSDKHFFCDYSDYQLVAGVIHDNDINAIIPGCTDASLDTFHKLRPTGGSQTLKNIVDLCLNKGELYSFFTECEVRCPPEYRDGDISHVVIVKPVDSFSGRGITVVDSKDRSRLDAARKYAVSNSESGEATTNTYIDGQLISFSVVMCDDYLHFISCVKEYCIQDKFKVDASYCVDPEVFLDDDRLIEDLNKIRRNLKIRQPIFLHFQCIKTEFETYFIEMMMRHPGDLYSSLVQQSTGVLYSELYAATFLDGQNSDMYSVNLQNIKPIIRLTLCSKAPFNGFQFRTNNVESVEIVPLKSTGDTLDSNARVGIAFMHVKTKSCLETYIKALENG